MISRRSKMGYTEEVTDFPFVGFAIGGYRLNRKLKKVPFKVGEIISLTSGWMMSSF